MKAIITAIALCLVPFAAAAEFDPEFLKNPPLAKDQTLPHGLRLLAGHDVIAHREQAGAQDRKKSFSVKVPSTSGHEAWWADQYVQQLENLGWTAVDSPPIKILTRQKEKCSEQMIIISLNPNSRNSPMFKNSNVPEIEFSAVAFNYNNSGECIKDD